MKNSSIIFIVLLFVAFESHLILKSMRSKAKPKSNPKTESLTAQIEPLAVHPTRAPASAPSPQQSHELQQQAPPPLDILPLEGSEAVDAETESFLVEQLGLSLNVVGQVRSAKSDLNEKVQLGHNLLNANSNDPQGKEIGEKAYTEYEESMNRILGPENYRIYSDWLSRHESLNK